MSEQVDRAVAFTIDNWDQLGVEEHAGVLHLPASIKRRNKAGGVDEVKIMLRNLTNQNRHKARTDARAYGLRLSLDLDRDKDLLEQLENYAMLSFAIRDPKTYIQHVPNLETLLGLYETQSLTEVWGRYLVWVEMLDPRYGELDAEQLWQVIVRIAKEKSVSPLVQLVGPEQHSCIVAMALAACSSPTRPSWVGSSETFKRAS
jgi:hypothetical protein